MKYFHDVSQKECRLWSEKSGITWHVKIGKPKANTIGSLVANTSWYGFVHPGYVNSLAYVFFENTVSDREVKKWRTCRIH